MTEAVQTPRSTPSGGKGPDAAFAPAPLTAGTGLTSAEAGRRLKQFGPNTVPDTTPNPLRMALEKFWAPVPWMLEAAIVLQIVLGQYVGAAIIACLLVFNAALGFVQEGRAQATLAVLKSRLALTATVRRNGAWTNLPAAELVPGDIVKLSLGAVVAADVRLTEGSVQIDQSMLTGESVPVEAGAGFQTYAGALVRRGEAVAEVTATGARTKFGRTAELVLKAHVVSSQQKAVLRVVRNLATFNGSLILVLVAYAWFHAMPLAEIISLVLTAVLASIPAALPATFTLAAAVGARSLARQGVLPTRLSAVDEAASIDVLCADKTGTLTRNELKVTAVRPLNGCDEAHVLGLAALAGSEGGQDPVDAAVRSAAAGKPASDLPKRATFVPFDPATKMSEAMAVDASGGTLRIVKGAFAVVAGLAQPSPTASAAADELESQGLRVLAVAAGPPPALELVGLIALSDPPRTESAGLVAELRKLGVRTVMVTGDAPATAASVARAVALEGKVCPPGPIPGNVSPRDFAVFAGVLPEGKYDLVKAFQKDGHAVGMCGDGADDAPRTPSSADGDRGLDGHQRRQVGSRHRAHRARPGRHRGLGQGGPGDVPAHPDLYAQLRGQEGRPGALPGGWFDHDRARDPDPDADGHRHDHRRLPDDVLDHRQCATVSAAQRLANRPIDDRGRLHGNRGTSVLQRRLGRRRSSVSNLKPGRCKRWPLS